MLELVKSVKSARQALLLFRETNDANVGRRDHEWRIRYVRLARCLSPLSSEVKPSRTGLHFSPVLCTDDVVSMFGPILVFQIRNYG